MYPRYSCDLRVVHSDKCSGSREDVQRLRTALDLAGVRPGTRDFEYALWMAARAEHRRGLRFLLHECRWRVEDDELLETLVRSTCQAKSSRTLDLGLRLMERLSGPRRLRCTNQMLFSLVTMDQRRNLRRALHRLGADCPIQTTYQSAACDRVLHHNWPQMAIWWKHHECLRLLLRHGGAVLSKSDLDQPRFEAFGRVSEAGRDAVSLLHAWANCVSSDMGLEERVPVLLHAFGADLWERDRDCLTAAQRLTEFPLPPEDPWRPSASFEQRQALAASLSTLMRQPRSLLSAARLSATRAMGSASEAQLRALPLPRSLLRYLAFEDLRQDAEEDASSDSDEEFPELQEEEERRPTRTLKRRASCQL